MGLETGLSEVLPVVKIRDEALIFEAAEPSSAGFHLEPCLITTLCSFLTEKNLKLSVHQLLQF